MILLTLNQAKSAIANRDYDVTGDHFPITPLVGYSADTTLRGIVIPNRLLLRYGGDLLVHVGEFEHRILRFLTETLSRPEAAIGKERIKPTVLSGLYLSEPQDDLAQDPFDRAYRRLPTSGKDLIASVIRRGNEWHRGVTVSVHDQTYGYLAEQEVIELTLGIAQKAWASVNRPKAVSQLRARFEGIARSKDLQRLLPKHLQTTSNQEADVEGQIAAVQQAVNDTLRAYDIKVAQSPRNPRLTNLAERLGCYP
jgi:hypothetical protein